MATDFDYNGAVFDTNSDSRYPLLKTGYIGFYPLSYSYEKCEDILACLRCETILNANETQRFLKFFVCNDKGVLTLLRPDNDDDYYKILWRASVEQLDIVECVLCHNQMDKVPTIRNSKDVPSHMACFQSLVPYLECAPEQVNNLIRVYLPKWCYQYLHQSCQQHFILEKLIWCFLRVLFNQKNNIKQNPLHLWPEVQLKENLSDEKETEIFNSPTGYMKNKIEETVDNLLTKAQKKKYKMDIEKHEMKRSENVFNIRGIVQLKFDAQYNDKQTELKFGTLALSRRRPYDTLAILLIVKFLSHPAYKSHYDKLLTSVEIHGKTQFFKLGHYDDVLKIAIGQSFGTNLQVPTICYLCVNYNNPTIAIGCDILNPHADCVDVIRLSKKYNDKYFQLIYSELPKLLLQYRDQIPNLLVARNHLICEIIGKCYDAVTKQKSISKRQKLFGIGKSKDNTSFDWNLIRIIGDCTYDWDKWTSDVAMLILGLSVADAEKPCCSAFDVCLEHYG